MDPSDLEEVLRGNDGSDDEGLQHHAGADAALGALLGLKKSGRKKGTLEAQRQGYQIRIRAMDLLEVRVSLPPLSYRIKYGNGLLNVRVSHLYHMGFSVGMGRWR